MARNTGTNEGYYGESPDVIGYRYIPPKEELPPSARRVIRRRGGRHVAPTPETVGSGRGRRPDGGRSRAERDLKGMTPEERRAEREKNAKQAAEDKKALQRAATKKLVERAGKVRARLDARLQRIETSRQVALNGVVKAEAERRAAVARGDTVAASRASAAITGWNNQLLDAEHREATAFGLQRRSHGFDQLALYSTVAAASGEYSGAALGDPVPMEASAGEATPRDRYGYGNKVREAYKSDYGTKAGEIGHAKEIRRNLVVDFAMLGQSPEWWDTKEGAQVASDVLDAHREEMDKHAELLATDLNGYTKKQERIQKDFDRAERKGDEQGQIAAAKKFQTLSKEKGYAKTIAEAKNLWGDEAITGKATVKKVSNMGLYFFWDSGLDYVLQGVNKRQNELQAFQPNSQGRVALEKAIAGADKPLQDVLMQGAMEVIDPLTGDMRWQTLYEQVAQAEAVGLTPEQAALQEAGLKEGMAVAARAMEVEQHPVLKHLYPLLAEANVADSKDMDFTTTRTEVQTRVMPEALKRGLADWRTSDDYKSPALSRIYDPGNYVELANGERGFVRSDGSIRTQRDWNPLVLNGQPELEPLWEGCVLGSPGCAASASFEQRARDEEHRYEVLKEAEFRRDIERELHIPWRDDISLGDWGGLAAAPMVPLSGGMVMAKNYWDAQFGLQMGEDSSAFDTKDYEQLARNAVDKWKADPDRIDPSSYGLFDVSKYGADEDGAFFLHEGMKIRRGQVLPVPADTFWSSSGRVEPLWHDASRSLGQIYRENSFERPQTVYEQAKAQPPSAAELQFQQLAFERDWEDTYYRRALEELRGPERLSALIDSPDGAWTDVRRMPATESKLADPGNPLYHLLINPLLTIAGGDVVQATRKEDGVVREEVTFTLDFWDVHVSLPMRLIVDSGDAVTEANEANAKGIWDALGSGDYGLGMEMMNDAGRTFDMGNAAGFGNFVTEFFGDVTNFIPFLGVAKRSVNAIRGVVAAGKLSGVSPLGKVAAAAGKGASNFIMHPDKFRMYGALAKDAEKAVGVSSEEFVRFLKRDVSGLVKEVGDEAGWKQAVNDVAQRFLEKNPEVDPHQLHNWVEENLVHVLGLNGVHVHTQLAEAMARQADMNAAEVARTARQATMAADYLRHERSVGRKRWRSVWKARRMAARDAKARKNAAAAPSPAAAPAPVVVTPPAAAAPSPSIVYTPAPAAAGAPAALGKVVNPVGAPVVPTARVAGTAKRGKAVAPERPPPRFVPTVSKAQGTPGAPGWSAEDVVQRIDAVVQQMADIGARAKKAPSPAKRMWYKRRLAKAKSEHEALLITKQRLDAFLSRLEDVGADWAKAAKRGERRIRQKDGSLKWVKQTPEQLSGWLATRVKNLARLSGFDQYATVAGTKAAKADFQKAMDDVAAVEARLAGIERQLAGDPFPDVESLLALEVATAKADVQAMLDYARDVLAFSGADALYRSVGRTSHSVDTFMSSSLDGGTLVAKKREVPRLSTAAYQANLSEPKGIRAPANLPEEVRARYIPGEVSGSRTPSLRRRERLELKTFREKEKPGGVEQAYMNPWQEGELVFPDLVAPLGSALEADPAVIAARGMMLSPDKHAAAAAYEWLARVFDLEQSRFIAAAPPGRYPDGYGFHLAGSLTDPAVAEELKRFNDILLATQGMARFTHSGDEMFMVVDRYGGESPRFYRVSDEDVGFRGEIGSDVKSKAELARLRMVEEMRLLGRDVQPDDFASYSISDELAGFPDGKVADEWYQPWQSMDDYGASGEFLPPRDSDLFGALRVATDGRQLVASSLEDVQEFIRRLEDLSLMHFPVRPGALPFRQQMQGHFEFFHALHGRVLSGDAAAFTRMEEMHDFFSRRFLNERSQPWERDFAVMYLMMESRLGLPFSYPVEFMSHHFTEVTRARGMFPQRALQMVQHRRQGIRLISGREMHPGLRPIYYADAGSRRVVDGRREVTPWHYETMPDGMRENGTVKLQGKTSLWMNYYHHLVSAARAGAGRMTVNQMVRRAMQMLDANVTHVGAWAKKGRRAMGEVRLRDIVLERGLHEMVLRDVQRAADGKRWVAKTPESAARLRGLYDNFIKVAAPGDDMPDFDTFVHNLGGVMADHMKTPSGSMAYTPTNVFGAPTARRGGKMLSYGHAVHSKKTPGIPDQRLRTAWERGVHGATGYTHIPASSPMESVTMFLVHRGYWGDATRHSSDVGRANRFLDEMDRFAAEANDPQMAADARKLVLDANAPAFEELLRKMTEQGGRLDADLQRGGLLAMLGVAPVREAPKLGDRVRVTEKANPLGALYIRASERSAEQIVDGVVERMRVADESVKNGRFKSALADDSVIDEYIVEAGGDALDGTGMHADIAFSAKVEGSIDELELQWARLLETPDIHRKQVGRVKWKAEDPKRLLSEKEVQERLAAWHRLHPEPRLGTVAKRRWDLSLHRFERLARQVEQQPYGPSQQLREFVGALVGLMGRPGLHASVSERLYGGVVEGGARTVGLVDEVKGALVAHPGLVQRIQRALDDVEASRVPQVTVLHGQIVDGVKAKAGYKRVVQEEGRGARATGGGEPRRDVVARGGESDLGHGLRQDPLLKPSERLEVEHALSPDGMGRAQVDERRRFVEEYENGNYSEVLARQDAAEAERLARVGGTEVRRMAPVEREYVEARRLIGLVERYRQETRAATDEAVAAAPADLTDEAFDAAVRAEAAPPPAAAGGAPPPEEPPLPVEPGVEEGPHFDDIYAGVGATDGMPSDAQVDMLAGADFWAALGGSEIGYYYQRIRGINARLRRNPDAAEWTRLIAEKDIFVDAVGALRYRARKGKPHRRTIREAWQAAQTVAERVEGVVPSAQMAYHATSHAGMVTEHARSLYVRLARARKRQKVGGAGLPDKVMRDFRPEHYDGINDAVGQALRDERGPAHASLRKTTLAEHERPDPGEYVPSRDDDPWTRAVVEAAVKKYCVDNNIPVWELALYQRVRTFMLGSQGRMRRGMAMLEDVGGDMDDFNNLRRAAADHEGIEQVSWLLIDHPEMTADQAAELLELRFQKTGVVFEVDEVLTEADATILERMFQHYAEKAGTPVADVNDVDALRAALGANGTLPPMDAKWRFKDFQTQRGTWSPRTLDEVARNGAWRLDDEREFWELHYAQAPGWVNDPRIDTGEIFVSREAYLNFQYEVGGMDDAAKVERILKGEQKNIVFEDYAFGLSGVKPTRDWMMQRKWAMERYGDRVHTNGVFHSMPWLMTADEMSAYQGKLQGDVPGLISSPDEIKSVQKAIEEVVLEHVGYFEEVAKVGQGVQVGLSSSDVHMLTFYMVQRLAATTPWKRGLKRVSKGGLLNAWGAFWTGVTLVNPAFVVSNVVDTPSKAFLFGLTEKYAKRGHSVRAEKAIPTMAAVGMPERSAYLYSAAGRGAKERILRPWGPTDRLAGLWDGITTGIARKVLAPVEHRSQLRLARQLYAGIWDEFADELIAKYGEEATDLLIKKRVAERIRSLFPSLDDAGPAERLLNRFMPFISYNFKNKLLWTGWVLDHPWTIDVLQQAQEELTKFNQREWQKDHPGQRLPESLSHQIRIPGTDMFLDIGIFTDAARGAAWITGDGNKYAGIENFVRYWIRPMPQQEALLRAAVFDLTGFGGRYVVRKVLNDDGVWDPTGGPNGNGYIEDYVAPGTAWGDRRFDYWNDMLPLTGLRKVAGDFLRTKEISPEMFMRVVGGILTFSEFGHLSETSVLQYTYFSMQDTMGYDAAAAWLNTTPEGERLKELWAQQFWDPDNPSLPASHHGHVNEMMSAFYVYDKEKDAYVFQAPTTKALRSLWLKQQPPEVQDEVRSGRDQLFEMNDAFDDALWSVADDEDAVQELWKQRRSVEAGIYQAHPRLYAYMAFGKSREEAYADAPNSVIDLQRANFFERFGWDKAPKNPAKLKEWEQDKADFLEANPEFATTLTDEYSAFQASQNRIVDLQGDAIRLAGGLERVRDFAYSHDLEGVAEAVGVIRDRNSVAFGMEAAGYDEKGQYKVASDSVWKKLLRGDSPASAWYGNMMSDVGDRAVGKDGRFNVAKQWALINRNPLLREEHMRRKGFTEEAWQREGQYYQFWDRWSALADKGQWDRAWAMWDNAPKWLADRYQEANPKGFREKMETSQYSTYMGKWVGMFEAGNPDAAMRYFDSLPSWVRERYYENHPGKTMSSGQYSAYGNTLDAMFAQIDKGDWDAARDVWDAAPSWVRSWYVNHNGRTPFESKGGGSGGGISDTQFRSYMAYMKQWVGIMRKGGDAKADAYFRSLPEWAKAFYLKRNPDKSLLMEDDQTFRLAMAYFGADREEQQAMLNRNPALARWLNENDTKAERANALNFIYSRLPDDPWLRRVFRERYPEVFSAEAKGKATEAAIMEVLAKHPDLNKDFMKWYEHITMRVEDALMWMEPRPAPVPFDYAAMRLPNKGMSAEEVAEAGQESPLRSPVEREREPMVA